jgi:hypothetical protein
VCLGGCDVLFGLERDKPAVDASPIDAASDAPSSDRDASTDARIDAPIDAPVGAVCPASYGPVNNLTGSYRYLTGVRTWEQARDACAADQIDGSTRYTHLAVIDPDPERGSLTATHPAQRAWIGVSDRLVENVYLWVTDEPIQNYPPTTAITGVSPWATGQPAHAGMADDCVAMDTTANFVEVDCTTTLYNAWCECDAFPINASHF